ncbi:MAG: helix-turn-helix domain-containing protein [Kiritimatiellae bacterium]|nr:helix-turn-helix domain-containing protein [Kiritimatiellia bacterium]
MPKTETTPLLEADKPLRAALYSMAGQLADEKMKAAIWRILAGEDAQPKPALSDPPRQEVLSGAEAAKMLRVSRRTITNLARTGAIQAAKFPGRIRSCGYVRASIESLLATRKSQ